MNTKSVAGEAVPKILTIADLESPALDAERFASVLYVLIDDAIGTSHEAVTGDRNTFHMTRDQVENIVFLAGKVEASTARVGKMLQEVL